MATKINDIVVRQAHPDDGPLIKKFFEENQTDALEFKYPYRWNWLFIDNPFVDDTQRKFKEYLPVWIAINQGRMVGMAGVMFCPFQICGLNVKAGWCVDFRVSKDYRGKGLGSVLQEARQSTFNTISLGMSDTSRHVKAKLGQVPGKTHTIFLHVRSFEPHRLLDDLLRYLKIKLDNDTWMRKAIFKLGLPNIFSRIIAFFFNLGQEIYKVTDKVSSMLKLDFLYVDRFDEIATNLWNNFKGKYSVAVHRDNTYLNWKFVDQPHINYQRYYVLHNNEVSGVLIFRIGIKPEPAVGIIAETYTTLGQDALKEMIRFAMKRMYEQGALMIQCGSTRSELTKILKELGFRPIKYEVPMFSFIGDDTPYRDKVLSGEWFMGLGDHDHDQYPTARQPSLKNLIEIMLGKIPGREHLTSPE